MSLKKNTPKFLNSSSINLQLTFFYSFATFILITIISLFLYWAVVNIFHKADQQFLSDEINIIKELLITKPHNHLALQQEVEYVPRALNSSVYHYYVRVLDKDRNTIASSPQMNLLTNHNKFFSTQSLPTLNQSRWWQSKDGHRYFLMQSFLQNPTGSSWWIQAALDVSYQQTVINKYFRNVVIAIFLGALFSILLGYFISRRAMRRLHELTATTKTITANALQQRIDPKFWPKELYELGIAYNQMLDRIEGSIGRLTKLSDDLAHELRTPISILMGESEITLASASSVEEYQSLVESNLEEFNRINQLIENILFLAQTENPQLELIKIRLDLKNEINLLFRFYQAFADEKQIKLFCEGQAFLNANSTMLRRMISNLLSNAIKYSDAGSIVKTKITEVDDMIHIVVSDNGNGIATEHLPNIFQRFYRTDSARNHLEGTGLGLAIVQSIVDVHRGKIEITSELATGTTVKIILPK